MINLKQVNKAIGEKFPGIFLVKGKGYFYIASDNEEVGLMIAGLYTTSIAAYRLNQLTIDQWVEAVDQLVRDMFRTANSMTAI